MGMSESPLVHNLTYSSHISTCTREARIIFKAGKNRDGFFNADDLLQQVDNAIDIFEGCTKGWAQGLFLFDNAPSHQKHAPDALSARNMVKGVSTSCFRCRRRHLPVLVQTLEHLCDIALALSSLRITVPRTACSRATAFYFCLVSN